MPNLINGNMQDVINKIRSVPSGHFTNRVFYVYDEEGFRAQSTSVKLPIAGVLYAGMSPVALERGRGLMGDMRVSVVYLDEGSRYATPITDDKTAVQQQLDDIRRVILDTKAPTGHDWVFQGEALSSYDNGIVIYEQVWETRVALTNIAVT